MGFEAIWERLQARVRDIHLLDAASDLCGWDRDVCMPPRGVAQRAALSAMLARLTHECWMDPALADQIGEALALAGGLPADDVRPGDLRELQRRLLRKTRLPTSLVAECAEVETLAQQVWAEARAANRFADFAPWLARLIRLARAKADAFGTPADGEAWDALADDYEPGVRARELRTLFAELVREQSSLVRRLADSGRRPDDAARHLRIPIAVQEGFVRDIATALGFDFERGRLDRSTHPFTSGTHPDDVRITTRFAEDDRFDALYSTVHQVGHGLYDQGLLRERAGWPSGQPASLGIHESQSRLWENHVGRSAGFWRFAAPLLERHAGNTVAIPDAGEFARAAWVAEPSLIRVDADEATYDLHVAIRFGIEIDLLSGALAVADLPSRWNDDYRRILGVEVPDDRRGCLQDVHWSAGMFGYFPTYTLGNLAAAQWMDAARESLGDLDAAFARGEFAGLLGWLRTHVHSQGGRFRARELLERGTGRPLSTSSFIRHVQHRFLSAYGLK